MLRKLYGHLQWNKEEGKRKSLNYLTNEDKAGYDYPHHDAFITPQDEAIYLLHIGAEVEHSLMIQYLYAAYSLPGQNIPVTQLPEVLKWRQTILDIAREEMGHLVTVQNILHLIGGPL